MKIKLVVVLCGLVVFAPATYATVLAGNVAINGVGPVNVSGTVIDFSPPTNVAGTGTGLFDIVSGSTGVFLPLIGTQASIRDLNVATVPTGGTVNYSNFVTFAAQPTWSITLTTLLAGIYSSAQCGLAPAAGQNCTPFVGSPFNLTNNTAPTAGSPGSSTVSFTFIGTAVDSTTPTLVSTVQGLFTSQFSDMTYQQILAIVSDGGIVTNSNSASISLTAISTDEVPEPGTLSMAFLGVLLIAGSLAKRTVRG